MKVGFDREKYQLLQRRALEERIEKFKLGRLYLEIGGKFLKDGHAARVLPGYDPQAKLKILKQLADKSSIIFCVNAQDIINNRSINRYTKDYSTESFEKIEKINQEFNAEVQVVINFFPDTSSASLEQYCATLEARGFSYKKRFFIENYPKDIDFILSKAGFGKDDYFSTESQLIIVTGIASGSGKMSTCLGQMWQDDLHGLDSGYTKFETFPIWNLPLDHPVNLAYEAATADLGDYNLIDEYHKSVYGEISVNYNRDVAAFELLKAISNKFVSPNNFVRQYHSPTDMGINKAGFAVIDDQIIASAALEEIKRRKEWYQDLYNEKKGEKKWFKRCEELEVKANNYLSNNY